MMKPLSQCEERNDETLNVQTTRFYMSLVSPEKCLFKYYLVVKSTVRSTGTHTAVAVFHRQKTPGVSVPHAHAELWVLFSQQEALGVTGVGSALRDL